MSKCNMWKTWRQGYREPVMLEACWVGSISCSVDKTYLTWHYLGSWQSKASPRYFFWLEVWENLNIPYLIRVALIFYHDNLYHVKRHTWILWYLWVWYSQRPWGSIMPIQSTCPFRWHVLVWRVWPRWAISPYFFACGGSERLYTLL